MVKSWAKYETDIPTELDVNLLETCCNRFQVAASHREFVECVDVEESYEQKNSAAHLVNRFSM